MIDRVLAYYNFSRKTKKWWKNIFFYLLDITISNCCVIYKKSHLHQMSYLDFRIHIVRGLLHSVLNPRTSPLGFSDINFSTCLQKHVIFVDEEKN